MSRYLVLMLLAAAAGVLVAVLALVAVLLWLLYRRRRFGPDDPLRPAWQEAAEWLELTLKSSPLLTRLHMEGTLGGYKVAIAIGDYKKTRYAEMVETPRYVVEVGRRPSRALLDAAEAHFERPGVYTRAGAMGIEVNSEWPESDPNQIIRTARDLLDLVQRHG